MPSDYLNLFRVIQYPTIPDKVGHSFRSKPDHCFNMQIVGHSSLIKNIHGSNAIT